MGVYTNDLCATRPFWYLQSYSCLICICIYKLCGNISNPLLERRLQWNFYQLYNLILLPLFTHSGFSTTRIVNWWFLSPTRRLYLQVTWLLWQQKCHSKGHVSRKSYTMPDLTQSRSPMNTQPDLQCLSWCSVIRCSVDVRYIRCYSYL